MTTEEARTRLVNAIEGSGIDYRSAHMIVYSIVELFRAEMLEQADMEKRN